MPKVPVEQPICRVYTINLGKKLRGCQFKKRAPRAIRAIKAFAQREMHTKDVRIESGLNKFVWSKGVRNVPRRVRIQLTRKRNDDDEAEEPMYTLVQHVAVPSYKALGTEVLDDTIDADDE
mmetsp:Transcript_10978/g.16467  ORF Transcript_10978/g.16467 Transcript_10978/m.16467 type:complete len:121 (+) Transcript_10978:251-613(+)|eukprot:CAMPEP_0201543948 /NCGR_PEP_ID=MMETSP0173_2-20130828/215_1 /ASSEMBLY_ACC=CAM_ASM_000268 /TAXON_ID=218659 /ORGANISM="Vexillifera sp., Strain DIVA3 564/2" /LENGTH=120 /DNA_ID=CAMNT_0047951869 /DNA_START=167 /DNA_END=529 /DNA_ORIENTATION=-